MNSYNPYSGVDEFGYYHTKGKGKGKGRRGPQGRDYCWSLGKGKGKGKGGRRMNGPVEQVGAEVVEGVVLACFQYGSRISVVEVDSAVVSYGLKYPPQVSFGPILNL